MINSVDVQTVISCRLLRRAAASATRPIVLWIGAGASAWAGFPNWISLAREMRREFYLHHSGFDNRRALELIDKDLPAFFQMCRDLNTPQYFRFLTNTLTSKPSSVLHKRLVHQIQAISPFHILTTNVDEMLEQCLGPTRVIQNSDLSLCAELLHSNTSFVGKLHGTVSSAKTMVFTTADYAVLLQQPSYYAALRSIIYESTVIFLAYGLRDQYLLDLIRTTAQEQELFGAGPHFQVTADPSTSIPNIHRISYRNERHKDHRSALLVLELVRQSRESENAPNIFPPAAQHNETPQNSPEQETAYYISDFKPPGTWVTEHSAEFKGQDGTVGRLTCGLGFSNDELHIDSSAAMHDFTVGLICFDRVYLQLMSVGALYSALGEDLFRATLDADVLRLIHMVNIPAVLYGEDSTFGTLSILRLGGTAEQPLNLSPGELVPEITIREMLERQVSPAKGKEREGSELIDRIEKSVEVFKYELGDASGFEFSDAVLMPHVMRLLGVGEGVLPTEVPLWLMFPYLRMADLVHTGHVCSKLRIQAAKVPFGGPHLVSAAFGIQLASEWAEQVASYSVSQRFDTNLGLYVAQQPSIIRTILKFRNSSDGIRFRREVGQALLYETGTEFTASVNAGLRRTIPLKVLQQGHSKLVSLMTESARSTPVPAVWSNELLSDEATRSWRRKSLSALLKMCASRGIRKDDPCICRSGDKLRLCCMAPLNS